MSNSTVRNDPTLIDRYQHYRTRRFHKFQTRYANRLPAWRTQRRRRALVVALAVAFAFMAVVQTVVLEVRGEPAGTSAVLLAVLLAALWFVWRLRRNTGV